MGANSHQLTPHHPLLADLSPPKPTRAAARLVRDDARGQPFSMLRIGGERAKFSLLKLRFAHGTQWGNTKMGAETTLSMEINLATGVSRCHGLRTLPCSQLNALCSHRNVANAAEVSTASAMMLEWGGRDSTSVPCLALHPSTRLQQTTSTPYHRFAMVVVAPEALNHADQHVGLASLQKAGSGGGRAVNVVVEPAQVVADALSLLQPPSGKLNAAERLHMELARSRVLYLMSPKLRGMPQLGPIATMHKRHWEVCSAQSPPLGKR